VSGLSPELAEFLAEPLLAVVGTKRRDGTVALTPVWFEYREDCFWLNSYESAAWPRRVQRDAGASLLVIDPRDSLRTAQAQCALTDVQRDGARAHIDALSERYLGHPYRGPHHERLTLRLRPVRIRGAVALGDLGSYQVD
jgi:PPOX class probable F420-dependent enzyme